jgi:hypothetical protein
MLNVSVAVQGPLGCRKAEARDAVITAGARELLTPGSQVFGRLEDLGDEVLANADEARVLGEVADVDLFVPSGLMRSPSIVSPEKS